MINIVVLDGVAQHVALRYDEQSRPELRFTLTQVDHATDGKVWTAYWPCCASGAAATRLAEEIEEGMHIALSSAKLCYRKRDGKAGLQSRMEILVWQVDRLSGVDHADASQGAVPNSMSEDAALNSGQSGEPDATPKRKPRYGKHLQREWRPSELISEN
jgi:hypothetical protein